MAFNTAEVTLHPDAQGIAGFVKVRGGSANNLAACKASGFIGGTAARRASPGGANAQHVTAKGGFATYEQVRDAILRQNEMPILIHGSDGMEWDVARVENAGQSSEVISLVGGNYNIT